MKNNAFDASQHQIKVKTPVGDANWACLAVPKKWSDDDKGNFQICLIVDKEEAQDLISLCTGLRAKMSEMMEKDGKVKLSPYNPWKETDDGRIEFRFKKPYYPAGDKYPESRPIVTFMPDGSKVDWNAVTWAVGNGSKVQIGGYARPYYVSTMGLGISLRLDKVKIHELQEYSAGSEGDDHGFSAPVSDEFSSGEVGQPVEDF